MLAWSTEMNTIMKRTLAKILSYLVKENQWKDAMSNEMNTFMKGTLTKILGYLGQKIIP